MDEADAQNAPYRFTSLFVLVLTGIGLVLVVVFLQGMTARPQVLQESPNWTLVSTRDATGILIPAISSGEITAQFGRDGNITGFSGCNGYVSAFIKNGDRIRITYPLHTPEICGDAGIMQQEATYYRNLASAATIRAGPSELDLLDANGTTLLVFHRI